MSLSSDSFGLDAGPSTPSLEKNLFYLDWTAMPSIMIFTLPLTPCVFGPQALPKYPRSWYFLVNNIAIGNLS